MDIQAYLRRINYNGSLAPTVETLQHIHLAHLRSVPFENFDVHLGSPIVLKLDVLFEKIVLVRRGGFCYELNGLFAWLLQKLGFKVSLLSASDAHENGTFGPEFDHLTLMVECPADPSTPSIPWLADVGWGDSFSTPLRLDQLHVEQWGGLRTYRIDQVDSYNIVWQHNYDGQWKKQYRFTLVPREYADFEPMCLYHQTSPKSQFTQKRICTLATQKGRITLNDRIFIVTENGKRQERSVDHDETQSILENRFGIRLKE